MNENEEYVTQILYYYNGKYYTLRREVKDRRQYYITLIEVDLEDGNDT